MNNRLLQIISSRKATLAFLVAYVILMATATIIEKFHGTPTAKALIYYSPLFFFLQFLMVLNFICITIKHRLISNRKWTYLVIHSALIVMLGGAMVTHLYGKEGMLHLREGARSGQILLKQGKQQITYQLPFEVELIDFKLTRYPGSQSPSSYESLLKIHHHEKSFEQKVYMNNVLDFQGFRFYQASYDQDEKGSILAVNYDVPGRTLTYAGYIMLFLGLALMVFDKHTRLRRLWKLISNRNGMCLCLAFFSFKGNATTQEPLIDATHAAQFSQLPMQSNNGRIIPLHTFASEVVRKFKAKAVIGNLTPEQFLLSVMVYPNDWSMIPLIEVNETELSARFKWKGKRISYRDAFDSKGNYRLADDMEQIYTKNPSERTRLDKELLKIDDRINLFHELLTRRTPRIFPNPSDTILHRWLAFDEAMQHPATSNQAVLFSQYLHQIAEAGKSSHWSAADSLLHLVGSIQQQQSKEEHINPKRLKMEVVYNQLNLPKLCRIGYLLLGMCMIITYFTLSASSGYPSQTIRKVLTSAIGFFFLLHTIGLAMRWYISGYAPWSNSYETMVFLAWAGVLCGFIFLKTNFLVTSLATLFGGIVLFVSGLSWMDPQITPLVPVLKSPWLMSHVAALVMAYGFLGICAMIGITYLFLSVSKKASISPLLRQLSLINELSMILGTSLLAVGIFLGAVWANESWGRYWSWDPKETWALITMIVYAIVLHLRWFMKKKDDRLFNLLAQESFLSILMTFLGVNYFLSGMHSYGSHDALSAIPVWAYVTFILCFIVPGILSYSKRNK